MPHKQKISAEEKEQILIEYLDGQISLTEAAVQGTTTKSRIMEWTRYEEEGSIHNGSVEGFWGILKRERYYGKRFTSKQELNAMIQGYIFYYNLRRVQCNLWCPDADGKEKSFLAA